jgi:uncharacterized Zn-binding protein involved in type VI secretion
MAEGFLLHTREETLMGVKGNYLFRGKTACGGVIIDGCPDHQHFGKDMACEGHRVTCGKHEGLYRIAGGIRDTIHGKLLVLAQPQFLPM